MAGKITNAFYRIASKRVYSAQTAAAHKAGQQQERSNLPKQDAKTTTLPNGLMIASVENYSPISRIAVFVKSGPRYETGETLGASHCLRAFAELSTKDSTIFGVVRNIQHLGGSLQAASTREYNSYTLQCIRDHNDNLVKYLADVATRPAFKRWELSDYSHKLKRDRLLLEQNPQAVMFECLHQAAFRGGLANSLYCPDFLIGKHSPELLQNYVKEHFVADQMAVVGLGIEHEQLVGYVQKMFNIDSGSAAGSVAKYGGGEVRLEVNSPVTYAAVVAEGASLKNQKDVIALALLRQILGCGSHIKYSEGASTKLGQAAAKATSQPFGICSLNVSYSDAGLFGFCVAGQPNDIGKLIKAGVSQMRDVAKNGITDQAVKNAKNALKAGVNISLESQCDLLHEMGNQALHLKELQTASDIEKTIDSVTAQDVSALASRVVKGKPAMAAVGRLHNVPHLDELV